MTPLLEYLTKGTLPVEAKKERSIKIKSRQYAVIGVVLYRRSFLEPWLWTEVSCGKSNKVRVLLDNDAQGRNEHNSELPGLPREIISDNGKQFMKNPFGDWCEKLNIKQQFAYVKHPQTNRLVERSNRSLGEGIKARLDKGIDQVQNDESLLLNVDMLEEKRERVVAREAKSKAKMEKYYNVKFRSTLFKPGDFVYQNNDASHAEDARKLDPK
ncbi:reverse transcriptase domain-containing protein [Tanacetum coccineum]